MVATTPLYDLPYPTSGDTYAEALMGIPEDLAVQVESTIAGFGGIAAPGAWAAPTLASGWGPLGSGYQAPQYRKVGSALYIRGHLLRSVSTYTAGDTIFTLPAGFLPPANVVYGGGVGGGVYLQVNVTSGGAVSVGVNVAAGGSVILTAPAIWLD